MTLIVFVIVFLFAIPNLVKVFGNETLSISKEELYTGVDFDFNPAELGFKMAVGFMGDEELDPSYGSIVGYHASMVDSDSSTS